MLLRKLREEIVEYGLKILKSGLVEATGGNLSSIDQNTGLIAIKPSSIPYEKIRPEDVIVINKEGKIIEGNLAPSSETPMHIFLYKKRPDIKAVIHTHAPYSTVLAVINKEIPLVTQDIAIFAEDKARVAPFELPGTDNLGKIAYEYLNSSDVVLLQNHGTLAVGKSLAMAYAATWALERAAMAYCFSLLLGDISTKIPKEAARVLREKVIL